MSLNFKQLFRKYYTKGHWYLNRLKKMPFQEILYRIYLNIRGKIDKSIYHNKQPGLQSIHRLDLELLFSSTQHIAPDTLTTWQNSLKTSLTDIANDYLNNRFDIFGTVYNYSEKIDWHLDWKTGKRWPIEFWSDIDTRDGFSIGGPKFVWETNRLYGLSVLGMTYRMTGEKKYADKIFLILNNWMDGNPYSRGINWSSGIELAIRLSNLIWGLSFLERYDFSSKKKEILSYFVFLHARHLYRYPSKYSSNNNHAVAEAFALFLAGVYFPHFDGSKKWLKFGKEVLERECGRQILQDGGSYESSTTYLSFVFDFFLLFKLVCEKNKIQYDPIVDDRLEQSCDFIHCLMDQNNNMPNIGDQDSAVLVNFGLDNYENFQSILNTGAVLFNRPEFQRDNFPDFKTCVLLGDKQKKQSIRMELNSKKKSKLLRESGVAVIRDVIEGDEFVFVGNATPLGMPPIYGHGHLDALSFTLSVGGLEFLIDPGTYLYHSGGKWRRYFRSTTAHNTIRINETDMSEQVSDFMFGKPYQIIEHSLNEQEDQILWQVGHDAYQNLEVPVSHVRKIIYNKKIGRFEITDLLKSKGHFQAEQFFHFHPECSVEINGNKAIIIRHNIRLEMDFDPNLKTKLYWGGEEPLLGWYSKAFNHLQECNTIVCRAKFNEDVELATTIDIVKSLIL